MVIEIGIIVILKAWYLLPRGMREHSRDMLIYWFGSPRGVRHLKIKLYTAFVYSM